MKAAGEVTAVRAEPRDDAEQVTQLLPGEPVEIEAEAEDGWLRIRTAYDYPGWIRRAALERGVVDPQWAAARPGAPLDHARSFLGVPYLWGGMTAAGIDCSGLVHVSYRRIGRLVPRDADQQARAGTAVEELEPGDLIVYGNPVDHVAFWLGEGRILHATGRDGVERVVEEIEPFELHSRRSGTIRL